MHFTNPSLGDVYFTYDMAIDETANSGDCDDCAYSPCSVPCPDKITWPATPPADQNFTIGSDTYTLQIVGIKDACEGGSSLPYFITQEYKNNVGYLVGRIVLTSRPDAIDDFYSTKTNMPLTVAAPGVLGNDFEKSGLDLDVVSYTQPAHGTVTVDLETGSMTYTPNADFCGTDTFTYEITNGQGKFDEATVTITVVCDDNNKCTIDACVDGICTHTEVNCDDGNICTDDSCDPATGECIHEDNTAPCDDGNACTENDVCVEGECTAGTPLTCNNGLFCDGLETCDAINGCQDGADPLVDDGVACTDDSCDETADKVVHTPVDSRCSDDDVCNGIETCDPATGCTNPDDLVCNNGLFCDGLETCDAINGCQDGADPLVDDGVACTDDSCDETADKVVHTPVDSRCSDDDVCNGIETCDPATGCTNPDDLVCNNGLFCDGLETCDAINGCQDGADPLVDDGVACTDDSCDETADKVVHTPVDSRCSDDDVCNGIETCDPATGCTNPDDLVCNNGLFCDGLETCDAINGCQDGADPLVDDGVACTDDSCDETADKVVHTPVDSRCSDDDVCNGIETCDPATGCTNPDDLVCNNGLFCDGLETCDAINGCQDGADPLVDDGVACTDDSCDETADKVVHTPVDSRCSDDDVCNGIETCDPATGCTNPDDLVCNNGLFCDGLETCDAINGCQDGADPLVDDGVACTDDSCDETADKVVHTPVDSRCSDDDVCNGIETCDPATGCTNPDDLVCNNGLFCDGLETCDAINGCQDGADPLVDDGVACTDDSCDETADKVVHTPVDSRCSDDDVCNGIETCDPATGCTNPDDLVCNNGLFCDGLETCDAINGCQDGADPLVDDGVACTDDSCDETD